MSSVAKVQARQGGFADLSLLALDVARRTPAVVAVLDLVLLQGDAAAEDLAGERFKLHRTQRR